MNFFCILFFFYMNLEFIFCLDFITGTATMLGVGAIAGYKFLNCRYVECCDNNWIQFDESKLLKSFKNKFFGQHLAEQYIYKSMKSFFQNNPNKPLVMSLNGLPGSGKNYVAHMIVNSTYKEGMASKFVHTYNGGRDFPHKQKVAEYQEKLRNDIVAHSTQCAHSFFLFDEVDKMAPGVLDALKPFVDYYDDRVRGTDFRKNIFVFLSNAGSSNIVGLTLRFWAEGRDREEISVKDIEPLIEKGTFNEKGGFQFSELLRSSLIDVIIPFLPLERKHVKECIKVELQKRNAPFNEALVNKIADELIYFPSETEIYSKSGCKRITHKIDLLVD